MPVYRDPSRQCSRYTVHTRLFQLCVERDLRDARERFRYRAPALCLLGGLLEPGLEEAKRGCPVYPRFASSAAFWNPAWSRPGTRPRTLSSILVIWGAPPTISMVQAAVVSTRATGLPAFSSPAESAMLRQAAC